MKRRILYLFSFLLLIIFQHSVFGQQSFTPEFADPLLEPWRWKQIPELRGKGIRCILESNDCSIWFGVDNGIYRYNGKEWTLYSSENSCIRGPINVLYKANDGSILAGSTNGLYEFQNNKWKALITGNNRIHTNVATIKNLSNGLILAGINQGILVFKGAQRTLITTKTNFNTFKQLYPDLKLIELPKDDVFQKKLPKIDGFFEYTKSELWLLCSGTAAGFIMHFDINKILAEGFKDYKITEQVGNSKLGTGLKIIRTKDNKIWIISGHYSSEVITYDGKRWNAIKLSRIFGGDELHTCLMEAGDGSVWVGGLGKLYVFKNNKWSFYEAPQLPIPYSRIIFTESSKGIIWIAGVQNEVYYLDYSMKKWATYKNLNFECEAPNGDKWFLTVDNKVVVQKKGKWYAYSEKDSLIENPVKIIVTRSGQVWVAGSHHGVAATAYLADGRWHKQLHPYLSWGIDYRDVFEAADGSIWFGGSVDAQREKGQLSGVMRLQIAKDNKFTWTHYTAAQGIAQSNAYGIGQSRDGLIWIGGARLLSFNGKKWERSTQLDVLNQYVNCIYSKQGENLWVGSRFYGLFSYNGKTWTQYNTDKGLSSNSIISIFAVNDSCVWVSTDNGICRFDGKTWVNKMFHSKLTMTREGGSIVVAKNGAVWINKSMREWKRRAFTYNTTTQSAWENFYTVSYLPDTLGPSTKIKVFAPEVDQSGNTVINWEGNDYWEDTPSGQLYYSYRLNNGEWSNFENSLYHTFTNLHSGNYTFEVRARDFDFNIDKNPATIHFVVMPPVWRRLWFILLLLTFIVLLSYTGYQIIKRNKVLLKLNNTLNYANQELTQQKEEIVGQQRQIFEHQDKLEYTNTLLEKQNEEIASQRDKLEDMVQTIEELSQARLSFFTNVSHEFRTPLTLILGPLEKLISGNTKDGTERKYLYNLIYRNAQRLLRLINQLLEFRKIEIGAIELSIRPGDMVKFLYDITNLFKSQATQRKIALTFHSSESPIMTVFDYDKIEKVIFNLLSNAFKFTPDNGKISVEVSKNNPATNPDNHSSSTGNRFIQITVKDTGIGIDKEHIDHVFEKFYQVGEYQRFSSGSGLGLAYIKELIEIHGGKITVTSTPGKGTSFNVFIPTITIDNDSIQYKPENEDYLTTENIPIATDLSQKDNLTAFPQNTQPKVDEPSLQKNETILIVEDDVELINYLGNSLQDYHVKLAKNGLEGYNLAIEIQPDLIVSDIMMPEMDGLELCQKLKTNIITSHIPIILLTARSLVEQKVEGYELGADDYIEKPFNDLLLLVRIKNLIDSRKMLRQRYLKDFILEPKEIELASADEKLINNVMLLIEKNLSESEFNIDEMCKQFYLSRSHFSRKIKQLTGLSPIELLTSFRLKRAAKLLVQGKISISEISYMVGFEHPNSLSRAFRKEFGMSPSAYVEQHRQ
jgi:signal transduction histidine kinase/DNA-binding response OmpR family regulator/ligand-binding sensor domain-containing protein